MPVKPRYTAMCICSLPRHLNTLSCSCNISSIQTTAVTHDTKKCQSMTSVVFISQWRLAKNNFACHGLAILKLTVHTEIACLAYNFHAASLWFTTIFTQEFVCKICLWCKKAFQRAPHMNS